MKYIISLIASRFNHPLLAGVLISSGALFLIGGVLQLAPRAIIPGVVPAFFGIYGILAGAIGLLAYLTLYVKRYISVLRDQSAPHTG